MDSYSEFLGENVIQYFDSIYKTLVDDVLGFEEIQGMTFGTHWLMEALNYNVPHGKKIRGLTVPLAYKHFVQHSSEEDVQLACILGWCVEMLQASLLVADDIMDKSSTRRGLPCWYKRKSVGLCAVNDGFLIEASMYHLLDKYYKDKCYYNDILRLFHSTTFLTLFGQSIDTHTGLDMDIDAYTMERYLAIVKYKTSFYTYYLPVAAALAMTGKADPINLDRIKQITLKIGEMFQVQDDYLDCFGDALVTGKIGTDIQDCKCTWLVVTAKTMCNDLQKALLYNNYGKNKIDNVKMVKALYLELGLPKEFERYEKEAYEKILDYAKEVKHTIPESLTVQLLNIIYKRTK